MAELGTVVGTAVVGKCTEILVDPVLNLIRNRITRLFKWESNVKNLKKEAQKLAELIERVLEFTEAAGRRGEEAAVNVKNWRTRAEKYKGEIEELVDDEDKAKKKCFAGLCPNPRARYQISKKVEEYLKAVAPLLEEAAGFNFPASNRPPPKDIYSEPVKGFENFDSRKSALNGIVEALRSAGVDKIGLHGMPGVGKTMLAKEVARQAKEEKLFDEIVMASVNKNPDLKKIQGEIADKLGLQLCGETEFGRAYQLKEYLKKKKKILVILDDIWAKLNLNDLGIPFEDKKEASSIGEEQVQCKILFASRFLNVLCDMDTQKDFEVGKLQEDEAWELFKKLVGNAIENFDLEQTAMEIAKECAGLPLAVEVVAIALRSKTPPVWRDALRELQTPSPEGFTGIQAKVYSAIELSYNHLGSKELQQTFLLCGLLAVAEDASIEDLLKYGIGLDLFHNIKTIGEARDRVLRLVSDLKSCSLLLDGSSSIHFDMHEMVCDVAISIASRDHHVLSVIDGDLPKKWSDREALEVFNWISLQSANISELPGELECPRLTLFWLCSKDPSMRIPENFFRGMLKLRVLNLSKLHFSFLPSSICLLENLQTLHVSESVLEDMAIIGKLMSLKILSLSGCDIEELPVGIAQLTQLKLLDLSDCTKLKLIRPQVLSSLSRLEELYLGNSFNRWDVVEEDGNQRNASLAELKDLPNLAALDLHVCDVQKIPKDFCFERLKRYKIFIGEVWNRQDSSFKSSKILKLELNTSISYGHSIEVLLKKTEELHLEVLKGFKNVVCELEAAGFQELKYLHVKNAPEVQHIVNSVGCVFPLLEELFLRNLNNLAKICHGRLRETSFSRLKIITVKSCNQLKNLFPFSVARQLQKLAEIRVTECSNMTEIVDEELQGIMEIAKASENFKLVQLRSLRLQNLPKFIRLCHGNEETNDSSSNPAPLFHEKIVFPNLEGLQLSCINIKSIWGSQFSIASSCIQSLKTLIIEGCDHLEHLWSSSMAKGLVHLRFLAIKKCKEVREIIEPENAEDMEDLISFPMLEILAIEHLENHTGFCSGKCSVEFPALKRLFIENCPKLKGFTFNHASTDMTGGLQPLFTEKASFPSLDYLCIKGLEFRSIWHHQLPANSFSKLKSLYIWSCDKLSTIVSSNILKRLCASLEELNVYRCCGVEEIFELGELGVDDGVTNTQLRILHFCQLPRLKHVCTRDPRSILTFRQLQSLKAYDCPNLQNLFQTSVAMELQQLERLEVEECGIKEVVAFGEGDEEDPIFVFSRLSTLYLSCLSRIRCFYPRKHRKEWPTLKKFRVVHCNLVNQFNRPRLHEFPVALPLISIEKVIPRLEKLFLTSNDIEMICNHQFPKDFFSKVKSLEVSCIHGDSAALPIVFLERFHRLQKLQIGCSEIKELFPPTASIDYPKEDVGRHLPITKLKLEQLSKLKYIWKQGPTSDLLPQNVKSLKVLGCESLISFSNESTASFRNLTTLLISGCKGLRNLFSVATAQSLVQLQSISVSNCHFLTEIVGGEGVGLEDVIVFSKLKVLKLRCLTRLASFCSANFTFMFPLLEQVTVIDCPYLETFCKGDLETPMLQRIQYGQENKDESPVVELNSTINQLYKEKVGYAKLQHLKLLEFPQLMEIWNKNPQEILDFTWLHVLEICNCGNLRYLLTPSMALSLVVLQKLDVQNCEMIEKIIIEEGGMEVAENKMIFPLLDSINLESCFNLTSFCSGSYGLEFPSLTMMVIRDCPKMVTFASTISTVQVKEAVDGGGRKERIGKQDTDIPTEPFFSDQVEFSSCLQLGLYSMNMQQIFNQQLPAMSSVIQSVGYLFLGGCGNLKYLFNSSMVKSLGQLQFLEIRDCKMMEEVIVTEGLAEEEMMLFPNLAILKLEGLPKLTRFCYRNCFVFPSLTRLDILKCPLLETFISSPTIGDTSHMTRSKRTENAYKSPLFNAKIAFPCLEELRIIGLENLRIIWHHQPPANSFCKLKSLVIRNCGKLLTIFSSNILGRLCKSLEELEVVACCSLQEIFELGEVNIKESPGVLDTLLRQLTIKNLPRLKHVWTKDPQGIFTFRNLQSVGVVNCPNLQNIFPASVAMECQQLEKLMLVSCGIEEVVAFRGEEAVPIFVFPCLSTLDLWDLQRLKCFYPGKHVTEWPMLKKFRGYHFKGIKETNVESLVTFPVQLPLFTAEKVIPRLEKLSLTSEDIAMICTCQFPEDFFSNVKVLHVLCYHEESSVFPFFFIERFFNLEKLIIGCSHFKELFPSLASNDCQEKDARWHLRVIRKLKLDTLPNLKYIWSQGSTSDPLVQNVESLKVLECHNLISLSESTTSFRNLSTLLVERCQGLRNLFSFATAQNLVQLQSITVENCHCLTEIVGGEGDGLEEVIVFSKLQVLKLKCSTRLSSFCSANFTFQFPLLEEVMVVQCPNFETFCHGVVRTPSLQRIQLTREDNIGRPVVELNDTINQLYKAKVGYTGLQYLKLSNLPQLMEIWNKNPQEILDFKQLCVLEICNCSDLRYLLTPSMALSLVSLIEIKVKYCEMMEQIIKEEEATEVDEKEITFLLIKAINLKSCPNLTSFCAGNYKLQCPSLSMMELCDCPKMVTLASTFSTGQVKEAAEGGSAERIGKEVIDVPTTPFFSDQVEFSSFVQLSLSSINMQQIFSKQLSAVSFVIQSVGHLLLAGCSNLKYLFTYSMIRSLGQLQLLEIRDCKMMKEVIVTEGLAEEEIMLFPNLGILRLERLPKLTRFCSGNYFVFPSLTCLDILNCPLLETFISSSTIGDTSHMITSKRIENVYKSPLFDAKIAFPSLERLTIIGLENLRIIWHHQPPTDSFCKLKSLGITNCGKLLSIFSSDIFGRLYKSLEVLEVVACGSLEEIFELGEVNIEESHGVLDTLLRELTIGNLPRLKHVWTKDPRGIFTFRNLQSVRAGNCPNLQNIFPASVAMECQQLEKLMLVRCGIEEVVAFRGEDAVPIFVFSCLSTLYLWDLERLKCFYPGKHVAEWPMLKKFRGYHFEGIKETNVESLGAFPVQLPLFTVEKVIPRLEKISLTSDDIAMICTRQFSGDLFSNVKVLRVLCYHNESSVFPFFFIERFLNLEKLIIGCSHFKELFPFVASIDCQEKDVGWHLRIRKLTLDSLINLKYIWKQGSPLDLLVPNLESLEVLSCDSLINLSESTASFRNLTTLLVIRCGRLRNLFSSTIAQSLVHLQKMSIEQCNLLSEIVGDEGDGLEDVIVFSKLKVLKLKCLERLTSFCSANFTFKFPLLEEVMVVQCPNFETFCRGVVKTPSLQRIHLTEEDNMGHPVVELNNTINKLYKEMVGYAGLQIEYLKLSDFPQLMEIWNKNPQEIMDFKQLHELEICNCGNLTYLLTPSMALSLVTLKMLIVENSAMMEHIITEEGAMEVDENEMTFPQLETISLDSCSNLTSFFVGNYKLVFPSLIAMEVLDCPKMVTFASTFSTVQVKEAAKGESAQRIRKEDIDPTEPFFSDQVSFPHLSLLMIHGMGSLNMIWDNQLDADSFYRLQLLFVTSCEKLLNIFPITMLGRLQNLGVLEIVNCVSLEKIFQHQGPSASESQALKSSQSTMVETAINFVLPEVRYLTLARLPNLKSVYPQMHTTEWPSLETLEVLRCNQLRILASELLSYQGTSEETQLQSQNEHPLFWVNKASFPNLEKLVVERNDSMKEIWHGDDVKDGILFSKLETLKLKVLPRLESFCSGGCNFEFPSLKDVIVMECPNLLTFSEGEISTPKLQKVKLTKDEDERYREDDFKRRILVKKKGMEKPQKLGICM